MFFGGNCWCPGIPGIFLCGSGLAHSPISHCWVPALCPELSGPTHQSVLYQVALQKSFKPRDRQTLISISSANNSVWPWPRCLFSWGFTFLIYQVSRKQAKSLRSRLEPLKPLLPWVRISLGGLGGTELSHGGPERTGLDIECHMGFENCLLTQGLIHSADLDRVLFPFLLPVLGWSS